MAFKLKTVAPEEVAARATERAASAPRSSKGKDLVDEFLASGEPAVTVATADAKERDSLKFSVSRYVKTAKASIWVRSIGGKEGTEILLINLKKADAATKQAYKDRPKVGRKPGAAVTEGAA